MTALVGGKKATDKLFDVEGSEDAIKEAAAVQAAATDKAAIEATRQFDLTRGDLLSAQQVSRADLQEAQQFQRGQIQPFQEAGVRAIEEQQSLVGLRGLDAEQSAIERINESPGQQFIRRRQERALLRGSAAIGGLGGGNVRTALIEQGTGFAQQDIQNQFGRLGQIAGQGQAAGTNIGQGALTTAGQTGQGALNTAGRIGQFGQATSANVGNFGIAGAEARASGILGGQQAKIQPLNQLLQFGAQAGGAALGFSDERLKTDIVKVGNDEFGNIYNFKYIGSDILYKGRMAQELSEIRPDAVYLHESGYLKVIEEFTPEVLTWH